MAIHKDERREGYVEIPHSFVAEVQAHILKEEAREEQTAKIFIEGTKRMDAIEHDLNTISGVISKADGFILAAQWTSKVVVLVGTALIVTIVWIAKEKNEQFIKVQERIEALSLQSNETLTVLKMKIVQDDKRHGEIDAAAGLGHGHAGNGKK